MFVINFFIIIQDIIMGNYNKKIEANVREKESKYIHIFIKQIIFKYNFLFYNKFNIFAKKLVK